MSQGISVVIAHHKGNLIEKCLASIEKADKQECGEEFNVDVFVITSDLALFHRRREYPNIHINYLINNPAFKRNYGFNLASHYTNNRYTVFLDDDVEVHHTCFWQLRDGFRNNKNGIVFASLNKPNGLGENTATFLSWTGFLIEEEYAILSCLSAKSACCMVKNSAFKDVGGFDEDFVIYGEESDLSWRMWLKGYTAYVSLWAHAIHYAETKYKDKSYYNPNLIYYHGCKNYITMLIKNLGWTHIPIVFINFALWLFVACFFVFKSPKATKLIIAGLFYNVSRLPYLLSKRYKIQKGRVKTDKDIFPFIYYNPPIKYYIRRLQEYLFPANPIVPHN